MIAADAPSKTILLGECKWRNNLDETETIESLRDRVGLVRGFAATHLAVFTKKPLSKATRAKYPNSSPNQSMSCIARCSYLAACARPIPVYLEMLSGGSSVQRPIQPDETEMDE